MTYKIRTQYKTTLFDIEFYVKKNDMDKNEWYLELHSGAYVNNLMNYAKNNISDDDFQQFAEDCDYIDELRGWLWETHDRCELFKPYEDIIQLENGKIRQDLEKILREFCTKYGLSIDTD